jgi:alpha-1,6-mannosyltransferase
MRVVQVANFYGPRSGGLRTAVDRLGAEYCAVGHQVYLVVPGPVASRQRLDSGVLRICMPAKQIPFTGGYRVVSPTPITALLAELEPRAIADFANRRTAANYDAVVCTTAFAREEFDRIDAPNVVTVPLGVDLEQFHPRRRCADVRSRWATPAHTLLVSLRAALRREACPSEHRHRCGPS